MGPKKQKKGWKHDAGDAAFDVFFECLGAIWKGLCFIGHIIITFFDHH